ncbi:hypothetical protein L1766_07205 [Thermovorax subterraneus]|nr:hypothetical protein [Thermovorax subterraneus]
MCKFLVDDNDGKVIELITEIKKRGIKPFLTPGDEISMSFSVDKPENVKRYIGQEIDRDTLIAKLNRVLADYEELLAFRGGR